MLVGAGDHQHVMPGHPHVAAEDVGGHAETGHVADVARAVGVRPGDGGQHLAHGDETSGDGWSDARRGQRPALDQRGQLPPRARRTPRRSSAVSSCGRENCTACSAMQGQRPLQREQLDGVRRERLGATAGLDVGEPGLVALRVPEHLAQVALAGAERRRPPVEQPCSVGGVHEVEWFGAPWVTTHRSALPVTAAAQEREPAQRLPQHRPQSATSRPAGTDQGPPAHSPGREAVLEILPARRRRRPDRGAPDRQPPSGGAAGAGRRASGPPRCAARRRRSPALPSGPIEVRGKVSSRPGARSTASRASRVGHGRHREGSRGDLDGRLERRQPGATLLGGAHQVDGREPAAAALVAERPVPTTQADRERLGGADLDAPVVPDRGTHALGGMSGWGASTRAL